MKKIIVSKYKILSKENEKLKGLMFLDSVKERMVFNFDSDVDNSFHSFFCPKFDIIFLDKNWIVKKCFEIKSWRIIKPGIKYRYVIEAESGFIRKNKIKIGDKIILDN